MKSILALPSLAALTSAFVLPQSYDQGILQPSQGEHTDNHWDFLPAKEDLHSIVDDGVDALKNGIDDALNAVTDFQNKIRTQLRDAVNEASEDVEDVAANVVGHDFANYTIYQLISASNYTKRFAKAVDEFPEVVDLLNSTKANYTLFVPIDEAFEDIPKGHEKPNKDFIKSVLLYHVGLGSYPARRILGTHTIATAYDEKFLGGEPQRLRVGVGLTGVNVNFYSKVVAVDFGAKNGVIHAVRNLLVPPLMVGRELSLFPSKFSTLLLAYEKTDFVKFIHHVKIVGSTVFAPSNNAFSALGPRANAFLFNSETGLKYLEALLKYHIAPNATLYSDAYYDKTHGSSIENIEREHYDLSTLLGDTHIGVDIARYGGFLSIRVNGFAHIPVNDGVAKNGVIQVVDKVLIPPCKHKHDDKALTGEIEVEDLVERLEPYME